MNLVGHYHNGEPYCLSCRLGEYEDFPIFDTEEVDCPEHCRECEYLLPLTLTEDGIAYVYDAIIDHIESGSGRREIIKEWWLEYQDEITDYVLEYINPLSVVEDYFDDN